MRPGQIVGPIVLIVVGTVFLVDNLMFDIPVGWVVSRFWPVILIGIGMAQIATGAASRRWGHLAGGAVTFTLGALFLMQELEVARFSQTWPAILLVVGALGLFRAGFGSSFIDERADRRWRGGIPK
jgi:hypothetical protein